MNNTLPTRHLAVAGLLLVLGFVVMAYSGRPAAPNYPEITAVQAAELLAENPDLTVLDVRTPGEFARVRIEGAVNIDANSPDFRLMLGKLDRHDPYLVHCRTDNRSRRALAAFRQLGFSDVTLMRGGISAWEQAGLPLVR